jgi:hypothetical protein
MDIIDACLSLVPVPFLHFVWSAFKALHSSIEHAQWSQLQLLNLQMCIAQLLQTLDREIRKGHLVETNITSEVEDLQACA